MSKIYQHWVGVVKGDIKTPLDDRVQQFDEWFPSKPDADSVTLIGSEDFGNEEKEIFHKVYEVRIKVGPVDAKLGIDVKFKGTIEYFKEK